MKASILLVRPNQASEQLDQDSSIRFVVEGGYIDVCLTGNGDVRVDSGNRQPLTITPIDRGTIVVRAL